MEEEFHQIDSLVGVNFQITCLFSMIFKTKIPYTKLIVEWSFLRYSFLLYIVADGPFDCIIVLTTRDSNTSINEMLLFPQVHSLFPGMMVTILNEIYNYISWIVVFLLIVWVCSIVIIVLSNVLDNNTVIRIIYSRSSIRFG